MNPLNIILKFFNSQSLLTVALMFSGFMFSGYSAQSFQNSREEVQIETQFEATSGPEYQTFSFCGFPVDYQFVYSDIFAGYGIHQLHVFNSMLSSFLT